MVLFLAIVATGALALAISPLYEVPQTDDWAYRIAVIRFLETGRFVDLGWGDPTLVLQVLWGGCFAKLFGPDYSVLRISTLVLVPITLVSAYFVLRHLGLGRTASGTAAVGFVFQPISLLLAYSFNTDFPYLALATLATALIVWADASTSARRWLSAGAGVGAAFLIRQTALFMIPVVLLALLTSGRHTLGDERNELRTRIRNALVFLAPVLLALVVTFLVAPRLVDPRSLSNGPLAEVLRPLPVFSTAIKELLSSAHTWALFALPILIAGVRSRGARRNVASALCVLAVAGGILLLRPWLSEEQFPRLAGWPYQGEYLTRRAVTASDAGARVASAAVWNVFTYTLPFVIGWLVVRAYSVRRELVSWLPGVPHVWELAPYSRRTGIVFFLGVVQFVPFLFAQSFYDRYLVTAVLAVFAVAAPPLRGALPRARRMVFVLATAVLAGLSLEWTRYQVARSQAIWSVAQELTHEGVPAEEIHAGFEWFGHHLFLRALDELEVAIPIDMEAGFPWEPLVPRARFIVIDAAEPPALGEAVTAAYRPFLRLQPRYVMARGTGKDAH